jgi:cytochrome c
MDRILTPRLPPRIRRAALLALLAGGLATPALAAGDPGRGADSFKTTCSTCHTANSGGPVKVGPNLFGVYGTTAGTRGGARASAAMQKSGLTWDMPTLIRYLGGPRKLVPGAAMSFPGVEDPAEAADIAAYLATLR